MGAIVSHRKQPRKSRVEHKAIAVNAFKATEQSTKTEDPSQQPITDQNSNTNLNEDSTNVAVSSWGEGVVGTSTHSLHEKGVVTSRGVDYDVTTSKDLYPHINDKQKADHSYAIVTPLQPNDAATIIQRHVRGHQTRKDLQEQQNAAGVIQKHVRGHQARIELRDQQKAAIVIQKKYRKYLDNSDRQPQQSKDKASSDDDNDSSEEELEKEQYRKAWKESTPQAPDLDKNMKIGDKTKQSFNKYQDDITDLKWKTEQQLELTTMGADYVPPRILLIASNVPRSETLQKIVKDDIILINYNFTTSTMESLLEEIMKQLDNNKTNSKAHSIGFVCKGGPGFINPVQGKMITKKKVKQDDDFTSFWKTLGTKMSKIDYQDTKIHIIGCNVAGNKQGHKLLKFLSKFMRPSKVKVESPLEMSADGKEMLSLYFEYDKYTIWKTRMHSKVSFHI